MDMLNMQAAFGSRGQAVKLSGALQKRRIASSIISTPKSLGLGCGLSVLFNSAYRDEVKGFIDENGLTSFMGFFGR
jgi:hypothetical protein